MNHKEIKVLILSQTDEIETMLNDFIVDQKQIDLYCYTYQHYQEVEKRAYDLIIIDNSDLKESVEIIQYIKHYISRQIPILISFEDKLRSKLNQLIEVGISDYIIKPYTKEMLKLRIQNNLNLIDAFKMSKKKELQFDALLNNTPYMAWFKDKNSHYITVNREFREHSGKDDETIHGRDDQFVWDGQIGERCREFDLIVMNERRQIMFDEIIPGKKGYRQFNIYKAPVMDEMGDVIGTIGIARDITELKNKDTKLSIILENIPFSVFLKDTEGYYIDTNTNFSKFCGLPREEIIGNLSYGHELNKEAKAEDQLVITSQESHVFNRKLCMNGTERMLEIYKAPVFDISQKVIGIVGVIRDITDVIRTQEHIKKLAYTDFLTHLQNRRSLYHYFQEELAQKNIPLTIMFIDLDNFKKLNDSFGHHVGDQALVVIAKKFAKICDDAFVARIGGDEFIAVWEQMKDDVLMKKLNSLLDEMRMEFSKGEQANIISVSIGVVKDEMSSIDVETLLLKGDLALYKAKEKGKNQYVIYTDDLEKERLFNLQMEYDLRQAIQNHEIELYYQPQYTVEKELVGFEALFRWNHPNYKHIPVDEIIRLIEELRLIDEVSNYVFLQACAFANQINQHREKTIVVSINISALSIMNDNFVDNLKSLIKQANVNPNYIGIEITETVLMENINENMTKILQLKDLGITISLDDFGTGYSSLNYLIHLPLSKVKIDRSFIQGMGKQEEFKDLVRLIINIAHSLDLPVVAEGVEVKDELDILKSMEIDTIQGYYFSRPVDKENAISLVKEKVENR
ncbi:MAG: EAL domain-containing protein [Turicibacter sp.]|nr:EAL domain-containing protein [Turicibacter sp.]